MHESGRQAVVLVDVGGSQVDGVVGCCPLWVVVWWIELDFVEDKVEVLMEKDGSVAKIVVVCCSVLGGVLTGVDGEGKITAETKKKMIC